MVRIQRQEALHVVLARGQLLLSPLPPLLLLATHRQSGDSVGVGTQPHPGQLLVPRVPRLPSMSMGIV